MNEDEVEHLFCQEIKGYLHFFFCPEQTIAVNANSSRIVRDSDFSRIVRDDDLVLANSNKNISLVGIN